MIVRILSPGASIYHNFFATAFSQVELFLDKPQFPAKNELIVSDVGRVERKWKKNIIK